ncbi:MAG TPA: hypothetical protein VFQ61_04060 [Polyangiaceae bacterium]|nr:hypothetical protein [Polyangiaceae bacterium]
MSRRTGLVLALLSSCTHPGGSEPGEVERRALPLEVVHFVPVANSPEANARVHHGFVYDPSRRVSIAFGGHPPGDREGSLPDTWTWDGQAWREVDGYPYRAFVSGAFQLQESKLLTFGGFDHTQASGYSRETWEFDGELWSKRQTAVQPSQRSAYGLAYDSERKVVVLFGGYYGEFKSDIWEWDGSTWTERCTRRPCSTAPRPAARGNAMLVYDAARKVSVIYGGLDWERGYSDTWVWDGTSFTEIKTTENPDVRESVAATYDPVSSRVLLFGGIGMSGLELNDLWSWDGRTWTLIAPTTPATPRQGAALVWDEARRRATLLGGERDGQAVEAWEFAFSGGSCAVDAECHSEQCQDQICAPPTGALGAGGDSSVAAEGGAAGTSEGGAQGAGAPASTHTGGSPNGAGADDGPEMGTSGGAEVGWAGSPPTPATRLSARSTSFYACSVTRAQLGPTRVGLWLLLATCAVLLRRRVRPSSATRNRAPDHAN